MNQRHKLYIQFNRFHAWVVRPQMHEINRLRKWQLSCHLHCKQIRVQLKLWQPKLLQNYKIENSLHYKQLKKEGSKMHMNLKTPIGMHLNIALAITFIWMRWTCNELSSNMYVVFFFQMASSNMSQITLKFNWNPYIMRNEINMNSIVDGTKQHPNDHISTFPWPNDWSGKCPKTSTAVFIK